MQVELVYEKTCPNIELARAQLLRAFAAAAIPPRWHEWEISSPDAPDHVHGYGSPTILVDGQDVSGGIADGDDYCCRVYAHDGRENKGIPAVGDVMQALRAAQPAPATADRARSWQLNGAMLPAVGIALLPKLACPACWPAYAGLLSSLGLGFVDYTPYLLPFTAGFLIIALAALGYRARRRRGYRPLMAGIFASVVLLSGKFQFNSDAAMYAGLALLMLASLWNTWPKPLAAGTPCPACVNNRSQP